MQECSCGCDRYDRHGVPLTLSENVRALQRIDSDIQFWRYTCTEFLANIKHWRFVHFAFTNDDCAIHLDSIKHPTHRIGCGTVGLILLSASHPACTVQSCHFGDTDDFKR